MDQVAGTSEILVGIILAAVPKLCLKLHRMACLQPELEKARSPAKRILWDEIKAGPGCGEATNAKCHLLRNRGIAAYA